MAGTKNIADDMMPGELNMTPMIDVVFQLLIFFMLASNMEMADVEPLVVPKIKHGDKGNPDMIVISVAHDENINCADYSIFRDEPGFSRACRHPGHWLTRHKKKTLSTERLIEVLRFAADEARNESDREISDLALTIRADKRAPWEEVQEILTICVRPEYKVMIWNVQVAAELEQSDDASTSDI
ncbi:MAG: biopolymer transporter ExbD, partial [Planctomycetota bacterium]|nr:biopolymer transporter ExbD [Planctomycetota bacterium]